MFFLKELKEFFRNILSWIYLLIGFTFFFFVFGLKEVELLNINFLLPWPDFNSFSVIFLKKIQFDLLPEDVRLIVTNPLSAFLAQLIISLFLSFIFTLPFFIFKIMLYLSPALFKKEKKAAILILFPSIFLFFTGFFFAYFFLIPLTFKVLYPYATVIGATPFFSVQEFISLVFGIMIAVGVMFLLPIFMILLSYFNIVSSDFWKKKWHYSFLIFLVFSAIITPDGSGVSMIILFMPMMALYLFGAIIAAKSSSLKIKN